VHVTNVLISDIAQLELIQDDFSLFGMYSAAILNDFKCEIFIFGTLVSKTIRSPYKTASQNIRILGIGFGCSGTNWSSVLSDMKSKIAHYKSTYKDSSLLFKAKVLNVFVLLLPISYYKLKVLHPPETYFQEVHKMICDFLWEGKRHWVKPLFIYLPVENGGLGIKNNFVQYLIFKQRAILKGLIRKIFPTRWRIFLSL